MPNQCCIVLPVGSIVNVSLVVGEATKPNFNLFLATNKIKFYDDVYIRLDVDLVLTFPGNVLDVQQAADLPVPGRPPIPRLQHRRQPSGHAGNLHCLNNNTYFGV